VCVARIFNHCLLLVQVSLNQTVCLCAASTWPGAARCLCILLSCSSHELLKCYAQQGTCFVLQEGLVTGFTAPLPPGVALSAGLCTALDCLSKDVQLAAALCRECKEELQQLEHEHDPQCGEAEIASISTSRTKPARNSYYHMPDWLQDIPANFGDVRWRASDTGKLSPTPASYISHVCIL
jgi:hypothetical protein